MNDLHQIFNDSYMRILDDSESFFDVFYKNFYHGSKAINITFKGMNIEAKKQMLEESMTSLIFFFTTKSVDKYLAKTAKIHRDQHKISTEMYDHWVDSLIETLAIQDKKFNSSIELAWRIILAPGIEFMKHGSKTPA